MNLDISARPTESNSYMLSSMEVTDTSNSNINLSQMSSKSEPSDVLANMSIPLIDGEVAEIEAAKLKQIELEEESSNYLKTIVEESTQTISVLDCSETSEPCIYNTTTANSITKTNTEEMDVETTLYSLDERSFFQGELMELARRLWKSTQEEQHYTKGCIWSPDGTCILVPVHLDGMHIMELPRDLYDLKNMDCNIERNISELTTAVHIKEGGTVYDYAWYPFMNSEAPESCCWLATRQHEPIHLWDAFNGELRCSYRGYDQVDEVEAAISVIFSNNGEKVLGGYKKSIKIFDTNTPGRDYDSIPVKKAVSCFAFSNQNENAVTTGSWKGYIDHYDLRARQLGPLFTLGGHDGGITWLRYSKNEPLMLFSGARRDNKLLQWDMRNYKKPLREFKRTVTTNQRIYFDLSPQEEFLVSGGCDGLLHIWDLTMAEVNEMTVRLHKDCCNGVSFHPSLPILATSAGQYHFVDVENEVPTTESNERKLVKYENSLLILGIS